MERLGDHELIALIGEGATAEVWRARRRTGLGQVVAIKRLRVTTTADQRARLRAEAAVLHDLDHPHIVRILDIVDDRDDVAIVMALAPGGTLADLRAGGAELPPGAVVAIVAPLADALASAHRRGIVHGDVKPANVLFTSDGEPLLADFGANRLTASGQIDLTPEYAAPEALAGREVDAAADVYALSAVAVELLTGAVPAAALLDRAEGAASLVGLLRSGLAADVADRPSAVELAAALRAAVPPDEMRLPGPAPAHAGASPGTRTFGPQPARGDPSPARRARPWVLGLAAVLAVGALGVVALGDDEPSCPEPRVAGDDGVQVVEGDFEGDGCATAAAFTEAGPGGRGVLRIQRTERDPFEVAVGGPGDVLFVGDWDCDGADRPALYRPADGTVVYLTELEIGASVAAEPLAAPGQDARVTTDADGCDTLAGA